ncbi:MAG: B12-binding domain-containing radical SAM protein [Methanoregula sp.]|nr:B12-binding domain-containing radical SAM protein [Methanoregula sp.]
MPTTINNENLFPYKPAKKILLIEPPFYRFFKYRRWNYPVTLTLIGTHLESLGHKVIIYDGDFPDSDCKSYTRTEAQQNYPKYKNAITNDKHPIWDELIKVVSEVNPDIVMITAITAKVASANILAHKIKEFSSGSIKIAFGGPHVQGIKTIWPDYNFGEYYDEIVTHIPGIVDITPNKKLILNWEDYPAMDFSAILTSSGCPFKCTFCCHSYEKDYFFRNIESIDKELLELKELFPSHKHLYVMDDSFLINKSRFNEITKLFSKYDFTFSCGGNVSSITEEILDHFQKYGGTHLHLGIESGSQKVLKKVRKNVTIKDIIDKTALLNERNIPWTAFIIVGFPFETIEDLNQTKELLMKIQPTFISINKFTPYPGTDIYNEYYRDSNFDFSDLFQLNANNYLNLSSEHIQFIHHLFDYVDKYNDQKKDKRQVRK